MEDPKATGLNSIDPSEAALWTVRARDGLTNDQKREFVAWIKNSPENVSELLEMLRIEETLTRHSLKSPFWGRGDVTHILKPSPHPPLEERLKERTGNIGQERHNHEISTLLGRAVSSTYLEHYRKDNRPAKATLSGLSILLLVTSTTIYPAAIPAAALCIASLAALALKESLVSYRITHGLFGSTTSEIRALLRFLIRNAANIDFDDRNGKRRPVFEPPARRAECETNPAGAITE